MKRSPIARIGQRGRSRARNLQRARSLVAIRSGGECEVFAGPDCLGRATQLHHRLRRSQGGTEALSNLLHVCPVCHSTIHQHPALAYERGWLIRGSE